MNVHHLLTTYGYGAVFVLIALESMGIPLPGETILIAAGTYAGSLMRGFIIRVMRPMMRPGQSSSGRPPDQPGHDGETGITAGGRSHHFGLWGS